MKLNFSEKVMIRQLVSSAIANREHRFIGEHEFIDCSAKLSLWSDEIDTLLSLYEKLENALS